MPGTSLPTGIDLADGSGGRIGTPAPSSNVTFKGSGGRGNTNAVDDAMEIKEDAASPVFEIAEQATLTRNFVGNYQELLERWRLMYRGLYRTDSNGNKTRMLSAKLAHRAANMGGLEVVEEGQFNGPMDTFDLTPVELGVNILKHPRYFSALHGADATERSRNQEVIRAVQNYMENPSPVLRNDIPRLIYDSIGYPAGDGASELIAGTDMAKRAALEIIQKFWRGEETPYVVGVQMTWTSFYFLAQPVNLGGYAYIGNYLEPVDPALNDFQQIPPEFAYYSGAGLVSIFDRIAEWNPQCYSDTGLAGGSPAISWLRKADHPVFERMMWRIERTWIGAPIGHWDQELFNTKDRPTVPDDFLAINPADLPV